MDAVKEERKVSRWEGLAAQTQVADWPGPPRGRGETHCGRDSP